MANNYSLMSEIVPCRTKAEQYWLVRRLEKEDEHEEGSCCEWEKGSEKGSHHVWVYSEENFDPERLVDIVCQFQEKFKIDEPWCAAWAYTCSKFRLGEFGGGGVVCRRGKAHWVDAHSWCQEKIAQLSRSQEEESAVPKEATRQAGCGTAMRDGATEKLVRLPCFGIVVRLAGGSGSISSSLRESWEGDSRKTEAYYLLIDGVESLILAHACAGIDIEASAYLEGVETAIGAIKNNLLT